MASSSKQIQFILELDKLKAVLRQTKPTGLDRFENSAEHSWQSALTAVILLQDAPAEIDPLRVLKMVLIHDVVEIDAGDVFTFDEAAREAVAEAEEAAARRIFGLLPRTQGRELLTLWLEFEAGESADSKFAKAIDRVCPVVQNLAQNGESWVKHDVSRQKILKKSANIADASPKLWEDIEQQINSATYLRDEPTA